MWRGYVPASRQLSSGRDVRLHWIDSRIVGKGNLEAQSRKLVQPEDAESQLFLKERRQAITC